MTSRYQPARRVLLCICLFVGLAAAGGGFSMLTDPSGASLGMAEMLPYFQKMPLSDLLYRDYFFPGLALLAVNCIPDLTAAGLLLTQKPLGPKLGLVCGLLLTLWTGLQFWLFPPNPMSAAFFLLGLAQLALGYAAWVFYRQEHFTVREADYPNIGSNPKRLVVYFSRMGYTKKLALETANRTGACVYELLAAERTGGTLGFWWCGRFGMHRWPMPLQALPENLDRYAHVTVCSPIWVFHLSAPVRAFCAAVRGQIRQADYILVHHQSLPYWEAAEEMDRLLGLGCSPAISVCCRKGDYRGAQIRAVP